MGDLVSIIVPHRERLELLQEAVRSVVAQTYRPIELLIVDDGSTEQTRAALNDGRFADLDRPGLSIRIALQDHLGAPAARNRGLALAKGNWIQFLDSDDQLHPQKIALQKAVLDKAPNCDFVWSSHTYHPAGRGKVDFEAYDEKAALQQVEMRPHVELFSTTGNVWSGLFTRQACERIGGWNETLKRWQDVEYQVRFTSGHPDCAWLPLKLYSMGIHRGARIHDYYKEMVGVQEGLHTLGQIELFLRLRGVRRLSSTFRVAMGNFYIGLAEKALSYGEISLARLCLLRGALRGEKPGQSIRCLGGLALSFLSTRRLASAMVRRRDALPADPLALE